MRSLIVASKNPGKAREIRAALEALEALDALEPWDVVPLPPETPDVPETGDTFIENAIQKAVFYSSRFGGWALADDSGLEVHYLDGRPGVFSARYAATDAERNQKLLDELHGVPADERGARFVCALALACDGHVEWQAEEYVNGRIAEEPAGDNGFGYDPLFLLPELGRTMGEIEPRIKNRLSHRGRALARLRTHLQFSKSS